MQGGRITIDQLTKDNLARRADRADGEQLQVAAAASPRVLSRASGKTPADEPLDTWHRKLPSRTVEP